MSVISFILAYLYTYIFFGGDKMTFAYDLVLNLCDLDKFYDFYEWDRGDNLTYAQKVPIFRINDFQMGDLLESYLKIDFSFLKKIYNKSITMLGNISYLVIFTDSFRTYAFQFNENGNLIRKSSLLIDEEEAIMEEMDNLDIVFLDYKVINKCCCEPFLTRKEKKIQSYLLTEIKSLYEKGDYDEIDFLYHEYFSTKRTIDEKYCFLIDKIKNDYHTEYSRLYDIIKLTYTNSVY